MWSSRKPSKDGLHPNDLDDFSKIQISKFTPISHILIISRPEVKPGNLYFKLPKWLGCKAKFRTQCYLGWEFIEGHGGQWVASLLPYRYFVSELPKLHSTEVFLPSFSPSFLPSSLPSATPWASPRYNFLCCIPYIIDSFIHTLIKYLLCAKCSAQGIKKLNKNS